jgi:hypothetical protein
MILGLNEAINKLGRLTKELEALIKAGREDEPINLNPIKAHMDAVKMQTGYIMFVSGLRAGQKLFGTVV